MVVRQDVLGKYLDTRKEFEAFCLGAINQTEMFGQQSNRGEVKLENKMTVNGPIGTVCNVA